MIKLKIRYADDQTELSFPCTEQAMQDAITEIRADPIIGPAELYVVEVIFPEELDFLQDRFVNLDEVNYLAKRMDSFFGDEEYQFYEAMKLEGFYSLPDLINLSFNLNRYPLIRDIGDMGKIGREYLLTVKGCVPAHNEDDPKYAQLGRELIQSGNGYSAACINPNVNDDDKVIITTVLNALGQTMYVTENMFETFTAFCCTGPIWFYKTVEALIDAGVYAGFSRAESRAMVIKNMLGVAQVLDATGAHPALKVDDMTSPAGVTIEALQVLHQERFTGALMTSVDAAVKKANSIH